MQRLLDAAADSTAEPDQPALPRPWQNLMRMAALCHDIGHGLMSHVSENALSAHDSVSDLLLDLKQRWQLSRLSLSEAAAFFMIGSPSFRELVDIAQKATQHELPPDSCSLAQQAIIAKPLYDRYPLLQELLSGPFDADKLDYMHRDARMAGIPVVTDVPRLVRKVRLVEVSKENLPNEIARNITGNHPSYRIHAISLAGARTLDELLLGRSLLFDKVYRHQKTRALEAMVGKIIDLLVRATSCHAATLPLQIDDDQLLSAKNTRDLAELCGTEVTSSLDAELKCAVDLIARLRERRCFVRAYAFAHYLPDDAFRFDVDHRSRLEELRRKTQQPEFRAKLLQKIVAEVRRAVLLLGIEGTIGVSPEDLANYVALDPPPPSGQATQISTAYLVTSTDQLRRFRDESAESPAWSKAYLLARDLGFIFAPKEIAMLVFLASELVFREVHNVRTPASALDYVKFDGAAISELRRRLTQGGFYKDRPTDLQAPPTRLSKMDVPGLINNVVTRLSMVQGVKIDGSEVQHTKVNSGRVEAWLRQFPDDDLCDGALRVLQGVRVLSRDDVHQAIRKLIASDDGLRGAYLCQLGNPKDSSSIITYYASDLAPEFQLVPCTLNEALAGEGKPIIFSDDMVGSGNQAGTILAQWLGTKGSPLKEMHSEPLSARQQVELRSRKLAFCFIAGMDGGANTLLSHCTKLSLDARVSVLLEEKDIPRAFDGPSIEFRDFAQKEKFRVFCQDVGTELLRKYGGKEREEAWIVERALGYGNRALLLMFPYNTPTQTLTLLWADGLYNGWSWLSLVPRRPKN